MKIVFYIGLFVIACYHACYLDFWKGLFFSYKHKKHGIGIYTCPDGTVSAVCHKCEKEIRFKQKRKMK